MQRPLKRQRKALLLSEGVRVMLGVCCLSYQNIDLKALFICLIFNSYMAFLEK